MTIDRIKFTKEFNVFGLGEWPTIEAQLSEGEDPIEEIKKIRQMMIGMYQAEQSPIKIIQKNGTLENDAEFDALKLELNKFNNKEDAISYLETTTFRYSIEAKNYINSKNYSNNGKVKKQ